MAGSRERAPRSLTQLLEKDASRREARISELKLTVTDTATSRAKIAWLARAEFGRQFSIQFISSFGAPLTMKLFVYERERAKTVDKIKSLEVAFKNIVDEPALIHEF
jgi:hypothetical protein